MSDVNETTVPSKVPVFGSFGFAYREGIGKYATYLKVAWLPAVVAAAVMTLPSYVMPHLLSNDGAQDQVADTFSQFFSSEFIVALLLATVLQVLLVIPLYAVWYRQAAMGPEFALGGSKWPYGTRERRLLLASLFLFLCCVIFVAVLFAVLSTVATGALAFIVGFSAIVAYVYCIGRMIPLLVGAAVGDEVSVSESWQITQGQGWRIFFSVLVLVISSALLFALIGFIAGMGGGFVIVIFSSLFGAFGETIGRLVLDAVLAFIVILPSLAVYCCFQSGVYGRLRERLLALRDRHPA